MESTAFFEKKISIIPSEFNEIKTSTVDSLLEKKAKEIMEKKCSEQGFVLSGTIKLLSRSMGYFESARFTGDAVYYVKLEGKVIYPADSVRVVGEVIRKNKMGLYIDYRKAIRIQIPRDLHIGSEEYEEVEVGDTVEVELKRSKFQINDPYILASGIFVAKKSGNENARVPVVVSGNAAIGLTEGESEDEADVEAKEGEEPLGEEEEEEEEEGDGEEEEEEEEDEDEDEEAEEAEAEADAE
uniref:S1 motif domain-containing protein n=1 Tax=viral metagenome TaxID=1070528 RepID=A0A6C0DTR6_9ZZZZ